MPEQYEDMINVGGPEYDAKDDYIKSLANIFYKINSAADCGNKDTLQWQLDYYVDILINRMIDPKDREDMRQAKTALVDIEIQKQMKMNKITKKESLAVTDRHDAIIETNKKIFGELITYFDRYYGFETQLAVMM
jgi:hypothetical protein